MNYHSLFYLHIAVWLSISTFLYGSQQIALLEKLEQEKAQVPAHLCNRTIKSIVENTVALQLCRQKLSYCDSNSHLKEFPRFCIRCDIGCNRCVKKTSTCDRIVQKDESGIERCCSKQLVTCMVHCKVKVEGGYTIDRSKIVRYCLSCEQECSLCLQGQEELSTEKSDQLEDQQTCATCGQKKACVETCDHGTYCSDFDCECKSCERECMLCFEEAVPSDVRWVKFTSCACKIWICNDCVIRQCQHNGQCPSCSTEIEYPKCDACRKYLALDDEDAYEYSCRGSWAPIDALQFAAEIVSRSFFSTAATKIAKVVTQHRWCGTCIKPFHDNLYRKVGKVVFRCPLLHRNHGWACDDYEIEVSEEIAERAEHISLLSAIEQKKLHGIDACHKCHREIKKGEHKVTDSCGEIAHTFHEECVQGFVNDAAEERLGDIGFYCFASHGRSAGFTAGETRWKSLLTNDNYKSISIPSRFTSKCSICKKGLEELTTQQWYRCERIVKGLIHIDDEKIIHFYWVHPDCLDTYLKRGVQETCYKRNWKTLFLTSVAEEKLSVYCPHHLHTKEHHRIFTDLEEAESIVKYVNMGQEKE